MPNDERLPDDAELLRQAAQMREALEDDMGKRRLPESVRDAVYWLNASGRSLVADALALWAESLLSERGEGWIPMKERQPADFERVLCVNSNGYMTTANRFHDTKLDCWNGSDYTAEEQQELVIGGITHWMRLPEPPK